MLWALITNDRLGLNIQYIFTHLMQEVAAYRAKVKTGGAAPAKAPAKAEKKEEDDDDDDDDDEEEEDYDDDDDE